MRIISILILTAIALIGCSGEYDKEHQEIIFEEIPMQLLGDKSYTPNATSTSGLTIRYASSDEEVARIENGQIIFTSAGRVTIYAYQDGNTEYYEAPFKTQELIIKDLDINKKMQTIEFELPESWKQSEKGQIIKLKATASSGLPVTYSIQGNDAGYITGNLLYTYHGGENRKVYPNKYEADITVIASQAGNDEYNPADNVERQLHIIADVMH